MVNGLETGIAGGSSVGAAAVGLGALPLVSIVTVVLNGVSGIERTVRSVLDQTYENLQYVIVDGGSTDGTLEVLDRYRYGIDHCISEPDRGIYDAMNKGIAFCSGATVGLLNAGDWYEPDFVARLIGAAPGDPARLVLFSDFELVHEDLGLGERMISTINVERGMGVSHQAMLVGRAIYDEVGEYDLRFSLSADYEFLLRLVQHGVRLVRVPGVGVHYLHGGESARRRLQSLRQTLAAYRLHHPGLSWRRVGFVVRRHRDLLSYTVLPFLLTALLGRRGSDHIRRLKKRAVGVLREL